MNKKFKLFLTLILTMSITVISSCKDDNITLIAFFEELQIPTQTDKDVPLVDLYHFNGKDIKVEWTSTNPSVLSPTGKCTLRENDVKVTLVAKATYKKEVLSKSYTITVLKDTTGDVLTKVLNSLMLPASVTNDISFPLTKVVSGKEVTLTWEADYPEIISPIGKVTRPAETTEVKVTCTASYNNISKSKSFLVTVIQGEQFAPGEMFARASVWSGEIDGASYPEKQKEFKGAVYHKVISSRDWWLGIETVVTLPEWIPDEGRTGAHPASTGDFRYLDNPSVYLGGNCYAESDVGLSLMVGSADAANSRVDYSASVAFRPFWRYMERNGVNTFVNASWGDTAHYYYPGDKIRMSAYTVSNDTMELRIELLEETKIEKYVKKRASYMLGENYSKVFTSSQFYNRGAGTYKAIFKHVNALDQVSNEAKPTQLTNAISKQTKWHEVYLYRKIDGIVYKVPMTERYSNALSCPVGKNELGDFTNAFIITNEDVNPLLGGMNVTLAPNNRK